MKSISHLFYLTAVGLLLVTGCQSSKPGSSSHAAVEIKGHSAMEIQDTTVAVFAENGFTLRTNTPILMLFDRAATTGEKVKYGDWMNDGMKMQVKVRLQSQPEQKYLLRADVYSVQDPNDTNFREEKRLMMFSSATYQKLLDDVAYRLKFSPVK
jgi:hypothetical protein